MGTMINRKKHFIEKNMKKLLDYMLYTHDVTCNRVDKIAGVMISTKKINKH